jgi:hypothetical protein
LLNFFRFRKIDGSENPLVLDYGMIRPAPIPDTPVFAFTSDTSSERSTQETRSLYYKKGDLPTSTRATVLLNISTIVNSMATVNFSVPEDIKEAFNETFKGENKSAILSRLMRDAIAKRERQQRRKAAVEVILNLRDHSNTVSDEDIHTERIVGRP